MIIIKKEKLKKGRWYVGTGRNSNIALWTGETFITLGKYYDYYRIKDEGLYKNGGCFIPIKLIMEGIYHGKI